MRIASTRTSTTQTTPLTLRGRRRPVSPVKETRLIRLYDLPCLLFSRSAYFSTVDSCDERLLIGTQREHKERTTRFSGTIYGLHTSLDILQDSSGQVHTSLPLHNRGDNELDVCNTTRGHSCHNGLPAKWSEPVLHTLGGGSFERGDESKNAR